MTDDHPTPVTDPSLYPRIPDLPPAGGDDVVGSDRNATANPVRNVKGRAAAGIVAAAAVAIGIGVTVSSHGSAAAQATGQTGLSGGQLGAGPGTGIRGGPGGFTPPGGGAGQMVMGTVSAVTASSVTVTTAAGTATYTVSPSTQVIVDGAAGTLAAIKAGDTVLVQVATSSSTSASRILVGVFGGPQGQQARVTST